MHAIHPNARTTPTVRAERASGDKDRVRDYVEVRHRAGSWNRERRAVARIEATRLGLDIGGSRGSGSSRSSHPDTTGCPDAEECMSGDQRCLHKPLY